MVEQQFKVQKSATSSTGYAIEAQDGTILDLPDVVYEDIKGKYLQSHQMLDRCKYLRIALAGVTNSLKSSDEYSFYHRSVLKGFTLKSGLNSVDDTIDFELEDVKQYEDYHTIKMGRDVKGDDNTIHAYLDTPKNGRLRCIFDKSIRVNAKRNNINFWAEDYKIDSGSNGGEFVRPIGQPVEIA